MVRKHCLNSRKKLWDNLVDEIINCKKKKIRWMSAIKTTQRIIYVSGTYKSSWRENYIILVIHKPTLETKEDSFQKLSKVLTVGKMFSERKSTLDANHQSVTAWHTTVGPPACSSRQCYLWRIARGPPMARQWLPRKAYWHCHGRLASGPLAACRGVLECYVISNL